MNTPEQLKNRATLADYGKSRSLMNNADVAALLGSHGRLLNALRRVPNFFDSTSIKNFDQSFADEVRALVAEAETGIPMTHGRGSQRYTFYCGFIGCHGQHLRSDEDCERGRVPSPVFARDYPKVKRWTPWLKFSVAVIVVTILGLAYVWWVTFFQ